jgi:4-hydroxy-tetrahydrodipicolinate synthase
MPLRPFGGPPSLDDLLRYFQALGESALPVCVYHNPGPGADPPPAWLIKLAELPHVEFFKESSRDLRRVGHLIEQIEVAGLAHYLTTMQMLAASLCLGGSGATMPPPASALGGRIIEAFQRGDLQEVWELQKGFQMFPAAWMHKGLAPVMKAAMSIIGIELGEPFPPYEGLTRTERDEVAEHLKRYGLARATAGGPRS